MQIVRGQHLKRKRDAGTCCVSGCWRIAERDKRRKKNNLFCGHHRHSRNKQRHLCRITFQGLKYSAKSRSIAFTISYQYFEEWCSTTNFLQLKGRSNGCMTVDRIDQHRGYEPGNIQMKEHASNIRKYYIDMWLLKKRSGSPVTRGEEYSECDWNEVEWKDGEAIRKPKQDFEIEDLPF